MNKLFDFAAYTSEDILGVALIVSLIISIYIKRLRYNQLHTEYLNLIKKAEEQHNKERQWNKVIITHEMLFIMDMLLNADNAGSLVEMPKNACFEGGAKEWQHKGRTYKLKEDGDVDTIYYNSKNNSGTGCISLNVVMLMLKCSNIKF